MMYRSSTAANALTMNTHPIDCVTAATVFTAPARTVGVNPRAGFGVGGGSVGRGVVVVVVDVATILVFVVFICTLT